MAMKYGKVMFNVGKGRLYNIKKFKLIAGKHLQVKIELV